MRAAETGRPMLRATNTGMTAIIAADGSVQAALPPFTTGVLEGEVTARRGLTPYARWGNIAFLLLAAAALTAAIGRRQPAVR
jgi:apolipoprotein N-acyltransferase